MLDRGAGALLDFFLLAILGVAVILAAVLLMRVTADSSALLALLSELSLLLLGPLYFLLCWYRWARRGWGGGRGAGGPSHPSASGVVAAGPALPGLRGLVRRTGWLRHPSAGRLDERGQARAGPHDRLAGTLVILRVPAQPQAQAVDGLKPVA